MNRLLRWGRNKIFPKVDKCKDMDMMLRSRFISKGKYEVAGVIFYADTHAEAIRKYRRGVKK